MFIKSLFKKISNVLPLQSKMKIQTVQNIYFHTILFMSLAAYTLPGFQNGNEFDFKLTNIYGHIRGNDVS